MRRAETGVEMRLARTRVYCDFDFWAAIVPFKHFNFLATS